MEGKASDDACDFTEEEELSRAKELKPDRAWYNVCNGRADSVLRRERAKRACPKGGKEVPPYGVCRGVSVGRSLTQVCTEGGGDALGPPQAAPGWTSAWDES